MIFGARVCSTTVAATDAPASSGVPIVTSAPSPIISTSASSITAPGSPASFSTEITSSLATLYCLPPVRITANMTPPIWVYARPAQLSKNAADGLSPSAKRAQMPYLGREIQRKSSFRHSARLGRLHKTVLHQWLASECAPSRNNKNHPREQPNLHSPQGE